MIVPDTPSLLSLFWDKWFQVLNTVTGVYIENSLPLLTNLSYIWKHVSDIQENILHIRH
jgi:hypothetical protein